MPQFHESQSQKMFARVHLLKDKVHKRKEKDNDLMHRNHTIPGDSLTGV